MLIKMWGRKTRDIIIEVCTIVKRGEKTFDRHVAGETELFKEIHGLIQNCASTCSESEHIKAQNGTLKRIEQKYDDHFEANIAFRNEEQLRQENYLESLTAVADEVSAVSTGLASIKTAKKSVRQMWADIGKIIATIAIILGVVVGIVKYFEAKKMRETVKLEMMMKQIMEHQEKTIDKPL